MPERDNSLAPMHVSYKLLTRGENSSDSIKVRNIWFLHFAPFTRLEVVKNGPHSSARPADTVWILV